MSLIYDRLTPLTHHLAIKNRMDQAPAFESGGAGLVATIDDYAKFATMLLMEGYCGATQVLKKRTIEFMINRQLTDLQQIQFNKWEGINGYTYGNLMRNLTHPSKACVLGSEGEYGWDGWLGTYFVNSPKDRFTFILMSQTTDVETAHLSRKLRNIIFASM